MEIKIPERKNLKVKSVRLSLTCNVCGNSWGIFVTVDGVLPYNWDVCMECSQKNALDTRNRIAKLSRDGVQ